MMRYATKDFEKRLDSEKTPTYRLPLYDFSSHARRAENDTSVNTAIRKNKRLTRQIRSPRVAETVHRSRGVEWSQVINCAPFLNSIPGVWPCVQVEDGYRIVTAGKPCDKGRVV